MTFFYRLLLCFVSFLALPTLTRNREPDFAFMGTPSADFFCLFKGRPSLPSEEDGFLFPPVSS
jgi:hypothetical protein